MHYFCFKDGPRQKRQVFFIDTNLKDIGNLGQSKNLSCIIKLNRREKVPTMFRKLKNIFYRLYGFKLEQPSV